MPVKKCFTKGVGTPFGRIGVRDKTPIIINGVYFSVPSTSPNGGKIFLDKNVPIPPSKSNNSSNLNCVRTSAESGHTKHPRRATSLNRERNQKDDHNRAPSTGRLSSSNYDCYTSSPSPSSNGASIVHNLHNKHEQKTGVASPSNQNTQSKSCTINLQPGHYNVNIEWLSASKPFLITFTPSKDKGEGRGTPPKEPEPLLYGDVSTAPAPPPSISFPRRIVHKLIRSSNSPGSIGNNHGHIEHHSCGMKNAFDNSRHNQRKGKHRWASISCVHQGNFDDSISEMSGCDSFAGYEGIEHLKRGSVSARPLYVNDNNSKYYNIASPQSNKLYPLETRRSLSDSMDCKSTSNVDLSAFLAKSTSPLHTVSCEAIINSPMDSSVDRQNVNERKTLHEDEAFLRQVVDEYFNENFEQVNVPSTSNLDNKENCFSIKSGITKSTSDCYLSQRSNPITANIISLQASSKMSSSCVITKTSSLLETVIESCTEGKRETAQKGCLLEENLVREADDTCSWHSDNSSGYEADTEPSDKETHGMFFWREWMSAPEVSSKSGRRPFKERNDVANVALQHPVTSSSAFKYIPRKSSSTGDTQRLSQSFVGVEKFRAHKLKRFLDDIYNESKVSSIRKIKRIEENADSSFTKGNEDILDDYSSAFSDKALSSTNTVDFSNNTEFVNKKYCLENSLHVLPLRHSSQRKSNTSLDERLSLDLTEKALSEGLVITQTNNTKKDPINLDSNPYLLVNNDSIKCLPDSCNTFIRPHIFENKYSHSKYNKHDATENYKLLSIPKSSKAEHTYRSKSCDSLSKSKTAEAHCKRSFNDDNRVYYNVRSFYSKNRNMKNVSKKRGLKHLNGDSWQSEEIPSCCISSDKFSSVQHSHGSSENMACSSPIEHNSPSYRSDLNLTQPFVCSVGRVQERVAKQKRSAAKETSQHSDLHVSPVSLCEGVIKEQSMPLGGKRASPLQQVPTPPIRLNKVSKYIMGNIQPGKENNSFTSEDSDSNIDAGKSPKRKSSSKVKSRKSFNTFLGSFGAAGALAKNISNSSDKKKSGIFPSSSDSEKSKDSSLNLIIANNIKGDTNVDKQLCPSRTLSQSHGHQTREIWTPANELPNNSPMKRKVKNEIKNISENSVSVAANVFYDDRISRADQSSNCDNEQGNYCGSQPIYENAVFHKHRYVGKFSYINSLIPTSDTEEISVNNQAELDKLSQPCVVNKPPQSSPSVISHVGSPIPCSSDSSVQKQKADVTESLSTNSSDQSNKFVSMDLHEVYEDFQSARGSPRSSVAMPFYDYEGSSDETEEASDGPNWVAKGSSSLCHSASTESVVSYASSFYYTAGGAALDQAVEAVTEYFSVLDILDSKESEISNSESHLRDKSKYIKDCHEKAESGFVQSEKKEAALSANGSEISDSNSDLQPCSSFHDYENAKVLVSDDKIFITLKSLEDDSFYDEKRVAVKDAEKLDSMDNELSNGNDDRIENVVAPESLSATKLSSKINPDNISGSKLRSRFINKSRPPLNYPSEKEKQFEQVTDKEIVDKFAYLTTYEKENSNIYLEKEVFENECQINDDGIVHAFSCIVVSEDEDKNENEIIEKDRFEDSEIKQTKDENDEDTEDLLESYYSQLARNMEQSEESSFNKEPKFEEETLTTEPEISSLYAQTTFSEPSEIFNENHSSPGNSESRHTIDEYRISPFSSSEGISEHSGPETFDQPSSQRSNDFGSSLSCDSSCDHPLRRNIFRVPLSGPTFPHRRHTFQFSPTSDQNISAFYAQRRSNPDLPPVLGSWSLSPTSPIDAKKPPRSPSHRGRDSSSVPREGRSSIQMRRRCRSVSSGSSVDTSKDGDMSSQQRPSSLISISNGHVTSSQESLHDFPFRFSPAAGDKAPNIRWLAERKKHEGNECYKNKDYRDALKLYTEAVELCPECAPYYSNRSACYMMLGKYSQALSDAREAVRLDSTFVKGYIRIVKCHIALGDPNAALAVLRQASELDPGNKSIREEEVNAQALIKCCEDADKASFRKDYRMAIFHLDRALNLASGCRSLKITKAEYLIYLHRYGDAQEIVNEILQFDSSNADAIYVRGMCLYYQNNHESAFTHFQHVLRLAPDHKNAKEVFKKAKLLRLKKDEGNQAFNRGNLQEALKIYTEALAVDPNNVSTNSKLYCNRATVRAKLRNFDDAVDDCTAAINLDEGYVKAYLRRAKCYQELEKHEDAVRDYEKACKLDRNQENKRLLQESKALLKRSKWKDYYKILGVSKSASDDEIKKSYKKMALQHHPDRHASASDKEKHEHEVKFKEIGEAYTVLTDSKKKAMYDRGQDVNDSDCGMFNHDDVDPNQIFQAFFGQGGSNAFGFGGGGFPGASFSGAYNNNNPPGGFHFQFS